MLLRLLASSLLAIPAAFAQSLPVGDVLEDYVRVLEISGRIPLQSHMIRPLSQESVSARLRGAQTHPWQDVVELAASPEDPISYGIFDPELRGFVNTDRPWGTNDGVVWAGRGGTLAARAGGFVRVGPLTASVRPVFIYTQNADFDLYPLATPASRSMYVQPSTTGNIDLPQRFGDRGFATVDFGESYVRLDYLGVAAGVSNENMWWGPGLRNAILMTNNAPGIPHGFLGTSGPANVGIGSAQARWIWGVLSESAYFDELPSNDRRFLTAVVFDFSPAFVPGLTLGGTRAFNINMPDGAWPELQDFLLPLQVLFKKSRATEDNPSGLDPPGRPTDQMLSLFGRWVFPESGFEIYGELGKGDHSWNLRDAFVMPEHAAGYVVGFQKAHAFEDGRILRLIYEHTSLGLPSTVALRPASGYFYTHSRVTQGYTQRGQVFGAGVGPGGMQHYLGADLFSRWGMVGGFATRTVIDGNRFQRLFRGQRPSDPRGEPEVELALGVRSHIFYRGVELTGGMAVGHLLNHHYVPQNDRTNLNLQIGVRYNLGSSR